MALPKAIAEADCLACWLLTKPAEGSDEEKFKRSLPRDLSHMPDFWSEADQSALQG